MSTQNGDQVYYKALKVIFLFGFSAIIRLFYVKKVFLENGLMSLWNSSMAVIKKIK